MKMFLFLLATISFFACAADGSKSTQTNTDSQSTAQKVSEPTNTAAVREIDVEGCQENVSLVAGQVMMLKLPATAGTGYMWQVVSTPDCLPVRNADEIMYEPMEKPEDGKVGYSTWQISQFDAAAAGSGVLELKYVRPFEADKIEQRCSMKITVTN